MWNRSDRFECFLPNKTWRENKITADVFLTKIVREYKPHKQAIFQECSTSFVICATMNFSLISSPLFRFTMESYHKFYINCKLIVCFIYNLWYQINPRLKCFTHSPLVSHIFAIALRNLIIIKIALKRKVIISGTKSSYITVLAPISNIYRRWSGSDIKIINKIV